MELNHLVELISELPQHKELKYVRGNDVCQYEGINTEEPRVFALTNTGDKKSWAPSYLAELAEKVKENEPFNISSLLNNKGSFRPILDTILAHTKEFYWLKRGIAVETVWIPSKPKRDFVLEEIALADVPAHTPSQYHVSSVDGQAVSIPPILPALRTKPFVLLAGISGTGKSRVVRKLAQATVPESLQREVGRWEGADFEAARWSLQRPANFELVQVKPNWHTSMDVVGYLSNIPSPHYVLTPFVNFVVRAWAHPDVPFFLCLDEMNLAPVEEYFAEFLSAIESRSREGGSYETDPIIKPFDEFGTAGDHLSIGDMMINELLPCFKASDSGSPLADVVRHLRKRGLTLPENLLVIGTVNMDETTFSFSRKVLDRAMSLEMNEVDFQALLTGRTDDALRGAVEAIGRERLSRLLVSRPVEAREVVAALGGEAHDVVAYLERVNRLLDGTPFKLGYRAANEALLYAQSSRELGCGGWREAMDRFTLMKILSRIEGDETKLRITTSASDAERIAAAGVNTEAATEHGELTLLTALRYIIADVLGESAEEGEAVALASVAKLDSMISQLARDHFVSYWN